MRTVLLVLLFSTPAFADVAPRPMPTPMTPEPKRVFVDGPALEPADGLQRWLTKQVDEKGRPRRVRLPVVLTRRSPLGVERVGHVGSEQGLALELDDSAMGVGLDDHARRACKGVGLCVLLLDGVVEAGRLRVLWVQAVKGAAPTVAQVER